MPDIIGIRFKRCGRIYDFEINGSGEEFKRGDLVIVESELGLSIGSVVAERRAVETAAKELKKVLRKATDEDLRQKQDNETFEKEAREYCVERIMARGIPMKLVFTETTLDKKRIIFYFTAEGRIDFRELVKDLAAKFKTRIEMRQIGVRDEAKIVGGFGICGRELCCRAFLTSFEPISIKMAKQQELVLNMSKLSGICGRLMCCLSYEISDESEPPLRKEAAEKTPDRSEAGKSEPAVTHDIVEDAPQTKNIHKSNIPASEHKGAETAQPDRHSGTEAAKSQTTEQTPDSVNKKRKKWRWRKFHKK